MKREYKVLTIFGFVGLITGILAGYLWGASSITLPRWGGIYEVFFFNRFVFVTNIALPFTILLLFYVIGRLPLGWNNTTKVKIFGVVLFTVLYVFGVTTGFVISEPGKIQNRIQVLHWLFLYTLLFSIVPAPVALAHSNILTISVAYIVTRDMKPVYKRAIAALIIILLISLVSVTPYIWNAFD